MRPRTLVLLALLSLVHDEARAQCGQTFRDQFDSVSFANNDGTLSWSTNWLEINESNGAGSGDIRVTSNSGSNRLRIKDNSEGAQRQADLTGATSAILSFVYRRVGLDGSSDYVTIDASSNGGGSWTELARFQGAANDSGYLSASYDLTPYIASNTRIRFFSSNSNGNDDIVYFDDVQIEICSGGPHLAIAHDGAGVICQLEPVTLSVHDAAHALDTSYTGTVTLSTSTGNGSWTLASGSGVLTDLGGGGATYAFAAADNGTVSLNLRDRFPETLNIDATDGTLVEVSGEDPDLVFVSTLTDDFLDQFPLVSYSNDDGTLSWAGDWIELDLNGAGPVTGNVLVSSGQLSLDDFPNTDVDTSAQREADLSSYSWATLSFDYQTTSGVDSNDSLFVEASSDGGSSWTVLENFINISGTTSGSRSYDLTPYIASNTRVRFRVDGLNGTGGTSCCYGGPTENFLVDNFRIEVPSLAACGADHYSIDHDGNAINCQEETVTIRAHDNTHAVDTGFTGSISLSTSTARGDWSLITGLGAFANSGSGNGTYSFIVADGGVVVLGLRDSFAETLNISVDDGTATESVGEDPDLLYAAAGFNFLADGVKDGIGTQIANKGSDVAPGAQTIEVQAVRTSDDTGACEAALQGSNTIDVAFECLDPDTCGARQVSVNGTAVAANDAGAALTYTPLSLDFGGALDSTAPIVISYPEVGRIRVHTRDTLSPSGEELLGGSNGFVARPFGFHVTASGNPAAADENGTIYTTAGSDFSVSASVALWEAADDADFDGVPDGHDDSDPSNNADLSNNLLALRFGQETAPETVELSASLVAPGGGNNPGLGGGTSLSGFSGGTASTANAYWDEVGIIEVVGASDGNYLGIGTTESAKASSRSGRVGRFTPHDFGLVYNTPSFISGCASGSFSYLGEGISYSVTPQVTFTAQSLHSTTTQNYTGSWFKLTPSDPNALSYTAGSGTLATSAPNAPSVADLGLGLGRVSFDTGPAVSFSRTTPVAPFDAEISLSFNLIDADDVMYSANPARFANTTTGIGFTAGKEMRFGRLVLANAFGSELAALAVPLQAEYWVGSYFTTNAGDGCTPATAGSLTLTPSPVALASTPTLGPTLSAGDAGLSLSATGAGNTGFFDLLFDLSPGGQDLPWLQGDWDGDGFFDDNPVGRATFGVFSGSDQLIYRREIY